MLNTIPIKQNQIPISETIPIVSNTIIEKGINKIEEKIVPDFDNEYENTAILFNSLDKNIFKNGKIENNIFKNDNLRIPSNNNDEELDCDNKKLIISVNQKSKKISIFDDKNNTLGFFTVYHIMKYLSTTYDIKNQFLKDLDIVQYNKSKNLIKLILCKLRYNVKDEYTDIQIYDYTKSGFMGDIELLIKLNNILENYQQNELQNNLASVDIEYRTNIEQQIKQFILSLLNYTLKVISMTTKEINNSPDKQLKNNLIKYSISIIHKINLFTQEQLKIINNDNTTIKNLLQKNIKIKQEINNKLSNLIKNTDKIIQ